MIGFGGSGRFGHGDDEEGHEDPERDFPLHDSHPDFAGRRREFEITKVEVPLGFLVRAVEKGKDGMGYEFSAFHATSPYLALYEVRGKIHRGLATRNLDHDGVHPVPTHDVVRGRITANDGGAVFVIDGVPLSLEEFGRMVCTNEGWEFELRFVEPG